MVHLIISAFGFGTACLPDQNSGMSALLLGISVFNFGCFLEEILDRK